MNCNQLATPDNNPQATLQATPQDNPLVVVHQALAGPAIRKAIKKGASITVRARKLPEVQVGARSVRNRPDDPADTARTSLPISRSQAFVEDAIYSTYLELLSDRNPEWFAALSDEDRTQAVTDLALKSANKLLYQSMLDDRITEPPEDDGEDTPFTYPWDDISASPSRPDWTRANAKEDELGWPILPVRSVVTGNETFDLIANTVYHLHDTLLQNISTKQWQTINVHVETNRQDLTAKKLRLNESTVSRNLRRGFWWQIQETRQAMERVIEAYFP